MSALNRLSKAIQALYHNATPNFPVARNDYESALFNTHFQMYQEISFKDLEDEFSDLGEIYQYGRGGRTVAPSNFVRSLGGGAFRMLDSDNVDPDTAERLAIRLEEFNETVRSWNKSIASWWTEEKLQLNLQPEIDSHDGMKRQTRTVVEWVPIKESVKRVVADVKKRGNKS